VTPHVTLEKFRPPSVWGAALGVKRDYLQAAGIPMPRSAPCTAAST
jgi:hypothetical protein